LAEQQFDKPNNSLNDTPEEDYKSFKDFEVKEEDEEEDANQNDFEVNNSNQNTNNHVLLQTQNSQETNLANLERAFKVSHQVINN